MSFRDIAKSTISILLSQFLITLVSVGFLAYFARILTKDEMALLVFSGILSGWAQLLGSLGFGTLAIRDVAGLKAEGKLEQAKILISSTTLYRVAGVLAFNILFWAASSIIVRLSFGQTGYVQIFKLLVLISFFTCCRAVFSEVQVAVQQFQSRSALNIITAVAERIFAVIGFYGWGITGFFTGFLIADVLSAGLNFFVIRQYFTRKVMSFADVFQHSRSYMVQDILGGAFAQIDRPVIAFLLGAEALAGYYLAKRFFDFAVTSLQAFAMPIGVKFGEVKVAGAERLQNYFNRAILATSVIFIPLGFFMSASSKPLMILFAGEKYASSYPIATVFGFALISCMLWMILREAGLRLLPPRQLLYQYVVSATTVLIAYFVLIPFLGAVGTPVAITFGYVAGSIPLIKWLWDAYNLRLPLTKLAPYFFCGVGIMLIAIPISLIPSLPLRLGVLTAAAVIFFSVLQYYWGAEEVNMVMRSILKKMQEFFNRGEVAA